MRFIASRSKSLGKIMILIQDLPSQKSIPGHEKLSSFSINLIYYIFW